MSTRREYATDPHLIDQTVANNRHDRNEHDPDGWVWEAYEQLNSQDRQVFDAIIYERLSYSQLAARLGVSKTAAWNRQQKAKRNLQRLLEEQT